MPVFETEKARKILLGPYRLTKYEFARLVGARYLQIALGAPVLIKVPPGVTSAFEIAKMEILSGAVPFVIRRRVEGARWQLIALEDLIK